MYGTTFYLEGIGIGSVFWLKQIFKKNKKKIKTLKFSGNAKKKKKKMTHIGTYASTLIQS